MSLSPPCFPDECGIVAQISQPLADSDISAYYISTFSFDHALVSKPLAADVTPTGTQLYSTEHGVSNFRRGHVLILTNRGHCSPLDKG